MTDTINIDTKVVRQTAAELKDIAAGIDAQYVALKIAGDDVEEAWQSNNTARYMVDIAETQKKIRRISIEVESAAANLIRKVNQIELTEAAIAEKLSGNEKQ